MNKETFKDMSIELQIKYMNDLLNDNKSRSDIYKMIGMPRTTLGDHVKRCNYKYDAITNQYIQSTSQALIPKNNNSISNKVIQKNNKRKNEIAITKDNDLIEEVRELLSMKDQLKELILEHNRSKSIIDVIEPQELKVDKALFKGELRGRLIKVYDNVNNDWVRFCKVNSQYKMQDLYSMALLNFINAYKK